MGSRAATRRARWAKLARCAWVGATALGAYLAILGAFLLPMSSHSPALWAPITVVGLLLIYVPLLIRAIAHILTARREYRGRLRPEEDFNR